jgi:hypothetical protein
MAQSFEMTSHPDPLACRDACCMLEVRTHSCHASFRHHSAHACSSILYMAAELLLVWVWIGTDCAFSGGGHCLRLFVQ